MSTASTQALSLWSVREDTQGWTYVVLLVLTAALVPLLFTISRALEPAPKIDDYVKECSAIYATYGGMPTACYILSNH